MINIWVWLNDKWHYILFPLVIILLVLWSTKLKQKKNKQLEEEDLPPEPPKGMEFFDIDVGGITGFKGQKKKTEQEIKEITDRSKRLAQEAKLATEDYQKKRIYFEKMGDELRVRYTLLQKQLEYIDSIIKNQEELEDIKRR